MHLEIHIKATCAPEAAELGDGFAANPTTICTLRIATTSNLKRK
jgi:hypothetical protein